jgi:hypothetical protein
MVRILFKQGEQRKFLNLVIERLGCVSLRGILQFGFEIKYSSLKNYYVERRLFGKEFFEDLCHISKINMEDLDVVYVENYLGQKKGGKISKRRV